MQNPATGSSYKGSYRGVTCGRSLNHLYYDGSDDNMGPFMNIRTFGSNDSSQILMKGLLGFTWEFQQIRGHNTGPKKMGAQFIETAYKKEFCPLLM